MKLLVILYLIKLWARKNIFGKTLCLKTFCVKKYGCEFENFFLNFVTKNFFVKNPMDISTNFFGS